jgi:hypothetical protein
MKFELDIELYGGVKRNGDLVAIVEIGNPDNVFEQEIDIWSVLAAVPGYNVAGSPVGYPTKKDRRDAEVTINNFERAAKAAVKAARKELASYKTKREMMLDVVNRA